MWAILTTLVMLITAGFTGFYALISLRNPVQAMETATHRLDLLPRLTEHLTLFQKGQPSRTPWPQSALAPAPPARPGASTGVFRGYPAEAAY